MKRLLAIFALLLLPIPVEAQLPTDSVEVTIYDVADLNLIVSPQGYRGFSGDTLTFTATAIDTVTGDTIDFVPRWYTDSPQAISIDQNTGFATFNNRGRYNVYVEVISIRQLQMAFFGQVGEDIGSSRWTEFSGTKPLQLFVNQSAQLCNYILSVEQIVSTGENQINPVSKSESLCPNMGGLPLPVVPVDWSSSDPSVACFRDECPNGVPGLHQASLDQALQQYEERHIRPYMRSLDAAYLHN